MSPWWARILFFYAPLPGRTVSAQQWRALGLLGAVSIVNDYDYNMLALALPQIQAGLAIEDSAVGSAVAIMRLGVIPALGLCMLADRVGRARLLSWTVVGFALCSVGTAFVTEAWQLVALQLGARVFMAAEDMLAIVIVIEMLDARLRGWGIGMLAAFGALGAGAASLMFSTVEALPYGWRALYVIGVLPLPILARLRRNLSETQRFERHRRERPPHAGLRAALQPLRDLVRMYPGRLAALSLAVIPCYFVVETALLFPSTFLQNAHGFEPWQVALLYLAGGALAMPLNLLAGVLSDRFGRRRVFVVFLVGHAAAVTAFYGGRWPVVTWIAMLASFFGVAVLFRAVSSELFPTSHRATASSVRATAMTLGGALGLWTESLLVARLGDHGSAIVWMAPVMLLAPLVVLLIPETAARELEEIAPER